jgi:hypothetical protein
MSLPRERARSLMDEGAFEVFNYRSAPHTPVVGVIAGKNAYPEGYGMAAIIGLSEMQVTEVCTELISIEKLWKQLEGFSSQHLLFIFVCFCAKPLLGFRQRSKVRLSE